MLHYNKKEETFYGFPFFVVQKQQSFGFFLVQNYILLFCALCGKIKAEKGCEDSRNQ